MLLCSIDKELHKKLKMFAAKNNLKMREVVERALTLYIEKYSEPTY